MMQSTIHNTRWNESSDHFVMRFHQASQSIRQTKFIRDLPVSSWSKNEIGKTLWSLDFWFCYPSIHPFIHASERSMTRECYIEKCFWIKKLISKAERVGVIMSIDVRVKVKSNIPNPHCIEIHHARHLVFTRYDNFFIILFWYTRLFEWNSHFIFDLNFD